MTKYLENIISYLKNNPVMLNNENDDGRLNSATNEDLVIAKLFLKFSNIEKPKIRSWYDFSIKGEETIYINIKISDLDNNAADNCSSKLGMGYALSGIKNYAYCLECFS